MFQNRKNLGSISWVVKINKKWWMKNTEAVIKFPQWCNLTLGQPKCVSRRVKFPKYVRLVTQLGRELLEKQILKFFLDVH